MQLRRWLAAVVTGLVLVPLTACGADEPPSPGPIVPFPSSNAPEVPENGDTSDPPAAPGNDCATDLEQCRFSQNQMKQYLNAIIPLVQEYYRQQHGGLRQPQILYVANGITGPEQCIDAKTGRQAQYNGESYEYCPTDEKIYLGQSALFALYQIDDAAPAAGLAHEWAHHAQKKANVPPPQTPQQTIVVENQADCVSGAWFAYAVQKGQANADDLRDISKYLAALGNVESANRDHGTDKERRKAFAFGQQNGAMGCNGYFPRTPLVINR